MSDRFKLEQFRTDRAESRISTALAEGSMDADLANYRFTIISNQAAASEGQALVELVDLLFQERLAAEEGVTLGEGELQAAVEADGTLPEARQIDALIVLTPEQDEGLAATDAGIADARERALAAAAELEAGGDPEQIAETHGPANHQTAWITHDDLADQAWAEAIFAAEEGDVTAPVEAATGQQLIALVRGIGPELVDDGFVEAVNGEVGEAIHRRNVELETLAAKLEQHIVEDALATEYDQVALAEIFIERSPSSTDDAVGEALASHILYVPQTPLDDEGDPTALADLADDDPAWEAAEAEAQSAFDELSAVEDVEERMAAFAERARSESDGPSGPRGGDLGWFPRESMVTEFGDAIWENLDPQRGDVLGPVRTEFGWHVILFDAFRSSLDVRVRDVQEALAAEGADFAAVAAEYSDGPEAGDGGATGWHVIDLLDDETLTALSAVEVGDTTEPIDGGDGYRIYRKVEEAARPLEAEDAQRVEATAFADWYGERYANAEDEGRISIDESILG
jgi:peptidyl-prolyl cis-trans isomerase C